MAVTNTETTRLLPRLALIDPLMRSREVREMVGGVSPSTLHLWRSKDLFPAPIVLQGKMYWRRSTIRLWLEKMSRPHVGAAR